MTSYVYIIKDIDDFVLKSVKRGSLCRKDTFRFGLKYT